MTSPPTLRVTGDLSKVLHARLTEADIRENQFSEIIYSLGLGALGATKKRGHTTPRRDDHTVRLNGLVTN